MAKFTKTIESDKITTVLVFNNKTYTNTLTSNENGTMTSNDKCFSTQIKKAEGISLEDYDIDIDSIDCIDEDEVMELLDQLSELED